MKKSSFAEMISKIFKTIWFRVAIAMFFVVNIVLLTQFIFATGVFTEPPRAESSSVELTVLTLPTEITMPSTLPPLVTPTPEQLEGEGGIFIEDNRGYTSWDELSPEDQAAFEANCTPEEIAILFGPRKWVTVPNVIGMTADEARQCFYNAGLVPAMNKYPYGHDDNPEGVCYFQDNTEGMRWNSDAGISLYFKLPSDQPYINTLITIPIYSETTNSTNPETTSEATTSTIAESTTTITESIETTESSSEG